MFIKFKITPVKIPLVILRNQYSPISVCSEFSVKWITCMYMHTFSLTVNKKCINWKISRLWRIFPWLHGWYNSFSHPFSLETYFDWVYTTKIYPFHGTPRIALRLTERLVNVSAGRRCIYVFFLNWQLSPYFGMNIHTFNNYKIGWKHYKLFILTYKVSLSSGGGIFNLRFYATTSNF